MTAEGGKPLIENSQLAMVVKHVHMESRIERKEWWYPYREYGAT